jgi:hypothetical protein
MLVRNLKLRIRQYLCFFFFFPNKYLLKKDEEKVQLGDLNISSKVKSTQVVRERRYLRNKVSDNEANLGMSI